MTPLRFDFDVEPSALPFCGNTPAARHASWTGAQAAAITRGSNLLKLLTWFSTMHRMTFSDFAKYMAKSEHALCSTWAAAKEQGFIVGTGELYSYVCNGRIVHREIHTRKPSSKRSYADAPPKTRTWLGSPLRFTREAPAVHPHRAGAFSICAAG